MVEGKDHADSEMERKLWSVWSEIGKKFWALWKVIPKPVTPSIIATRLSAILTVEHEGREVHRIFSIPVPKWWPFLITVHFIRYDAERRWHRLDFDTEGGFEMNGKILGWICIHTEGLDIISKEMAKGVRYRAEEIFKPDDVSTVQFRCISVEGGELFIWHSWENPPKLIVLSTGYVFEQPGGTGGIQSNQMLVTKKSDRLWLLECGNTHDESFDDIVAEVSVEILPPEEGGLFKAVRSMRWERGLIDPYGGNDR